MESISKKAARVIALNSQGLGSGGFGKGIKGAENAIEHLGYVQIDTLAVVSRAHHHTLWNRVASYNEKHIEQLILDRKIFEYWSHAASILPMKDFRFSLLRKNEFSQGRSHWFSKNKKVMNYVLDRIKNEGPLMARDFETPKRTASWFDWKPAKQALEQLFMQGTLMISQRKGFQKVYNLTERVLPSDTVVSVPSQKEFTHYLVDSAIRAHGLVSDQEISYLRRGAKEQVRKSLNEMVENKEVVPVIVEGIDSVFYTRNAEIIKQPRGKNKLKLISPFDNVLIQRKRIERLFGFNYQLECYVPEPKRQFGYFCLPILFKDNFIGRLDPKADKKTGVFCIKSLFLEPGFKKQADLLPVLAEELKAFAKFNGCDKFKLEKVDKKLKMGLQELLK